MITPAYNLTATERVLPVLSLDFTSASLDPRITFTRTDATATVTNSNGFVEMVAANTPRFDFNPITLVCRGLLIEEARSNLFLQSQMFSDAVWNKTRASVSAVAVQSPDGTNNTFKLIEDTSVTISHRIGQIVSYVSGTTYTMSVYAKAAERSAIAFRFFNTAFGTSASQFFNLSNGTIANTVSGITATITPAGNGWYRCSASRTATANTTQGSIVIDLAIGTTFEYTGDGVSGAYIYGAQLEAGAFATSYIPTTTTALTRNADVATMTGTNFSDWYNIGAGSWYIQTNAQNADTVLTAGAFTLTANATALKKYANSYATDQSATSLVLGRGTAAKVSYYKQALLAAELAALVN